MIKSIPRNVPGIPVPTFVRHPRQRGPIASQQKYYYAVEAGRVYRFAWPSDRDLWVAQGQGSRQALRATHQTVRAAKDAAARGEYQWPTPEWAKPA